jgi:hypothetical protein
MKRLLEKLISSMPPAKCRIVVNYIIDVSAGSAALQYAKALLTLPHFQWTMSWMIASS